MSLPMWWKGGVLFIILLAGLAVPLLAAPSMEALIHAPGEVLVRWADPAGEPMPDVLAAREALRARMGARVLGRVPQLGVERWRVRELSVSQAVVWLSASPLVAWAEPNYYIYLPERDLPQMSGLPLPVNILRGYLLPNDPYYGSYAQRYLQRLGVETAWNITQGRPDIVVAVVDTGVDCAHEDLRGACWTNPREVPNNGVDDDGNGYVDDVGGWNFAYERPDPRDVHYHGTHVAGIIAARTNNGVGIAGMAGNVTIMPLGVFSPQGVGTYYDLIRAILYAADNGAHVINMSLGATTYSLGEALAVEYAARRGILLVAAAGNNGSNRYFYPAAHAQVIGVAATDASDWVAGFSNRGDFVSVAAPGVSVISTIPGSRYGALSGTSMASPHVAGLAALVLSRNPRLPAEEVRRLIETHAQDQVGPPTVDTPGWDPYYGYGRIHAGDTVSATVPSPASPLPPAPTVPQLPWRPACTDRIGNGGFEGGRTGWQGIAGRIVETPVYEGSRALRLSATEGGRVWQEVTFPATTLRATFFMALRIETRDSGDGNTPTFPFDDWLVVRLVDENTGDALVLLRAGNTSDSVTYGLLWDEVVALLPAEVLGSLRGRTLRLELETGSDGDSLETHFTVDAVRLCTVEGIPRAFLPWAVAGRPD